ncbi:MAG: EFR1 family ferrodoxin [Defluviitaleaceae bacterium]|nr:EFR1 family ferrodoxin [Defluviitaleaceae bacterium]
MSATIYYFSGTGNSYRVAKAMCEGLGNAELINIAKEQRTKWEGESSVIGIVFPLYYFGIPIIAEEFLRDLEISEDTYVFVIVTRGEPMAGGTKRQLDEVFAVKGRGYQFFQYITMGNNFPLYGFDCSKEGLKEKRDDKADKKVLKFISDIKMKRRSRVFSILDYRSFPTITYSMPRYGYKHFLEIYSNDDCFKIDEDLCVMCGKCEYACSTGNMMVGSKVVWKHEDCQMCLACYNCCPENAIQYVDPDNKVDTQGKRQYWNFRKNENNHQ